MRSLGRFLQFVGLLIVPMGLFYYFGQGEDAGPRHIFGELLFLAVGSALFLIGTFLAKRQGS